MIVDKSILSDLGDEINSSIDRFYRSLSISATEVFCSRYFFEKLPSALDSDNKDHWFSISKEDDSIIYKFKKSYIEIKIPYWRPNDV